MIGRGIDFAIWMIGAGAITYALFFVPVGERTIHQHVARIWATPEAQELQHEVKQAALRGAAKIEAVAADDETSVRTDDLHAGEPAVKTSRTGQDE